MSLIKKFNLVFIAVFLLGMGLTAVICNAILQRNAREEVMRTARLMMETANASRSYTTHYVAPLLRDKLQHRFLPEVIPAFGATKNIDYLRIRYPQFFYKEAVLNPTNPRDRALGWEVRAIQLLRKNSKLTEVSGVRSTSNGDYVYLGRAIKITEPTCLKCHSTPDAAPASMIARYGPHNGFGWKHNDVVGAQLVSVPVSLPVHMANQAFKTLMFALVLMFALTLLAVNLMLRFLVVHPVSRLAHAVDAISRGDIDPQNPAGQDLPVRGQDEIAALTGAFNRMRRSIYHAIKLLDQ